MQHKQTIFLTIKSIMIIMTLVFLAQCSEAESDIVPSTDEIDKANSTIQLRLIDNQEVFTNSDPISFVLDVLDTTLSITNVEIMINDSLARLPVSLQNWESPNTYASYYWYNDETLPLGKHTIKALVYDEKDSIITTSIEIEIEDYRQRYLGDYLFSHYSYPCCDPSACEPIESLTTTYDGSILVWELSDSTKFPNETWPQTTPLKRLKINYESGRMLYPVLNGEGFCTECWGRYYQGGSFIGTDTLKMSWHSAGNGGCGYSSVVGIRK